MTTQEKKDPRSEYDEDDSHDRELQLQGASGVVQHATPSRTGLAVWSPPTCEILGSKAETEHTKVERVATKLKMEEIEARVTLQDDEMKVLTKVTDDLTVEFEVNKKNNRELEAARIQKVDRLENQMAGLATELTIEVRGLRKEKDLLEETVAVLTKKTDELTEVNKGLVKDKEVQEDRLKNQMAGLATELRMEVRGLKKEKDLLEETVAVLTKKTDELTEVNKGLVKDKEVQGDRLAMLESQISQLRSELEKEKATVSVKAKLESQLKQLSDCMVCELDNEKAEKSLEEFEDNEAKETEEQQADEVIQVQLARAKDETKDEENKSLVPKPNVEDYGTFKVT